MAMSIQNARWLSTAIFTLDVAVQIRGITSTPNVVDINNANLSFFSPNLTLVVVGFAFTQIVQSIWLYRLWTLEDSPPKTGKSDALRDRATTLDFVPYFALCHVCLAAWTYFWTASRISVSLVPLAINALALNYHYFSHSWPELPQQANPNPNLFPDLSRLTKITCSLLATMSVIDVLHVASVTFFNHQTTPSNTPGFVLKVFPLVLMVFAAVASGSGVYAGGVAVGLLAFATGPAGQKDQAWGLVLGLAAVATGCLGAVSQFRR